MEGLDNNLVLAMFIESPRAGNLYVSLQIDTPKTYALAIRPTNRYTDTEDTVW